MTPLPNPADLLEAAQPDLALAAEEAEDRSGVDRREFLFMSLVAAAASTFGGSHAALAQAATGGSTAPAAPPPQQQAPVPPYPLGNGEPMAEQFMPYPAGTGALMQDLVKKHGAK